jgi:hypothetical protein
MSAFVIDTNVPVVANGKSKQADDKCVIACIEALSQVIDGGIVVLDSLGLVLQEYMDNLRLSGQPGPGDIFMKWVFQNQAVVERCEQVQITPCLDGGVDFEEFPRDADLRDFDRDDRKFVAVALASSKKPAILNAVDSDWAIHHAALNRNGVKIEFLCPQHVCPVE